MCVLPAFHNGVVQFKGIAYNVVFYSIPVKPVCNVFERTRVDVIQGVYSRVVGSLIRRVRRT